MDTETTICSECLEAFVPEHENYFRCPKCHQAHLVEVRQHFDRQREWRRQHPKEHTSLKDAYRIVKSSTR